MQRFEKPLLTVEELSAALYAANEKLKVVNDELTESNTKLRSVDRIRTDMFSNISHDLRSPITAIKSAIEYVLSDESLSIEEIRKNLKIMETRVNTLESFINDIFSLATLESKALSLQPEPLDLIPFLEEFFCECEMDAKYHDRKLVFQSKVPSPLYVNLDVKHILRVMDNLFSNALKYTHSGDTISLMIRKEAGMANICIKDNGIGIHPENIEKVFQRSFMEDKARTPDARSGFGLGLCICKEIVNLHHGHISCTSTFGKGSTFIVSLPIIK